MRPISIARKYAYALFLQSKAAGNVDVVRDALRKTLSIIQTQPRLRDALAHPFFPEDKKLALIRATVGKEESEAIVRFLQLVIKNQRLSLLDLMVKEFEARMDHAAGVTSFSVTSAFPLSDKSKKALTDYLSKKLKRVVRLDATQTDPSLLGGLVASSRDHVIDLSLAGRLRAIEQDFLSN